MRIVSALFMALGLLHLPYCPWLTKENFISFMSRVVARISAEVTKPYPDRPFNGIFIISTELSAMASPAFDTGRLVTSSVSLPCTSPSPMLCIASAPVLRFFATRQNDLEAILSRILEKAIRRSNALDTESLCILTGQTCWMVRADVHVLDFDGGLADACCLAVVAALRHFRRPDVSIDGGRVTVHPVAERVPVPLAILHSPFCVTFSFYDRGELVLVDATLQEEHVRDAELVVSANAQGEVCQVAKLGGAAIDALSVLSCIEVAVAKAAEMHRVVARALEADEKARDVEGLMAELRADNDR